MQLLQDVFIIEKLQVLNEGAAKDTMRIRGVFGRCNEKNNNGRIYPTSVLESQLKKVQPLIQERRLCGELDHPSNDTVKLSNASHLITKLEIKGNELIGEAEILKTPAGLTAKALIDGGVRIGISSRGMGTLSEDAQGNKIVNEDFRLVTFDLVADPSTRGAFPSLAESTQSRFVRESQTKLQKESNFVTLLRSKLREEYALVLTEKGPQPPPPPPSPSPLPPQQPSPSGPPSGPDDADPEEEQFQKYMSRYQAMAMAQPQPSTGNIFKDYIARYHQQKSIENLAQARARGEGQAQKIKLQNAERAKRRAAAGAAGAPTLARDWLNWRKAKVGIGRGIAHLTGKPLTTSTEYARIGKILAEALFTKIGKGKFGMVSTPKKAGGKASVFRSPTGKEGEEKVLTTSARVVKTSTKRADQWEKAAKKREGEKD
jgi:hypothetical protein